MLEGDRKRLRSSLGEIADDLAASAKGGRVQSRRRVVDPVRRIQLRRSSAAGTYPQALSPDPGATMQAWQDAPEALRRAIEALELVPADEQLSALQGFADEQGIGLAEEVARILQARKVARRRVAQMSDAQIRARAHEVMQAAVASGRLSPQRMAEILAAGDLRAKMVEFIANGYIRASPRSSQELRRILRGDAGNSSPEEDPE